MARLSFKLDTFKEVSILAQKYKYSKHKSFQAFLDEEYKFSTVIEKGKYGDPVVLISNEPYEARSLTDRLATVEANLSAEGTPKSDEEKQLEDDMFAKK